MTGIYIFVDGAGILTGEHKTESNNFSTLSHHNGASHYKSCCGQQIALGNRKSLAPEGSGATKWARIHCSASIYFLFLCFIFRFHFLLNAFRI
mmetsp:Transcript_10213/g.30171  ORF Transcript_10213/g.30171 Transcript_10213/m.30171 type:complete len:93 (-) Transcript_10213:334-612(-)